MTIETTEQEEAAAVAQMDEALAPIIPTQEPDDEADKDAADDEADKDAADDDASGTDAEAEGTDDGGQDDSEPAEDTDADDDDSEADDAGSEDDETEKGDEAEEEGDGTGDGKDTGDDEQPEVDPVNDPIPESLKGKTRERIESLIGTVKDLDVRAKQFDEMVGYIESTGTNPDQYSMMLGTLSLYNSPDVENKRKALEVLRSMVKEVSTELGEGGADALAEFSDLQDEVVAGTLTQERAEEIAGQRARQKLLDERQQQQSQQTTTQEQNKELHEAGLQQITAAQAELQTDPMFKVLYPTLVGVLRTVIPGSHPSEWGRKTKETFAALKANYAVPAQQDTTPPSKRKQPQRHKAGAGGSAGAQDEPAKSAEEAIDRALGNL